MILDAQNLLSKEQVVTGTAVSTNTIDLKQIGRQIGTGEDMYLVAQVDAAMTDAGSDSTVTVELIDSATDDLGSPDVKLIAGTFAALSAAGSRLIVKLPVGVDFRRYLGVRYTVANGDLSTGSFSAFLVKDVDAYKSYASGYTVA